jgi:hypothetical protein
MSLTQFYLPCTFIGLGSRQALLCPLLFFDLQRHCNYFRPSFANIPWASVKEIPFYFSQDVPIGQSFDESIICILKLFSTNMP